MLRKWLGLGQLVNANLQITLVQFLKNIGLIYRGGKMSENLQENLFEEKQTDVCQPSYQGDFHANPIALQENVWRLMMSAIYGANSLECIGRLTQDGLWEKMFQGCSQAKMEGFFGRVLRDLAEMGCSAWWYCFPAYACGAKYIGERVCIVATSDSERWRSMDKMPKIGPDEKYMEVLERWEARQNKLLPYPERIKPRPGRILERNDDGISRGMDRLKAYGNSVNCYQFYPIFKVIREVEETYGD